MLRGQLDQQLQTRYARILLARLSARTLPTNSSAVCLTATNQQLQTRYARVLLAHLSASTLPTNSPLDCLLNGNEPAISDALRARFTGSPIGSHVAYKQSTGLFA